MKVTLNTGMAGADFSYAPGEVVDFDKETAKRIVDSGQGEYVTVKKDRKPKDQDVDHD